MSFRFSGSSEAYASELPENLEAKFPLYYMHSNMLNMFKSFSCR